MTSEWGCGTWIAVGLGAWWGIALLISLFGK
jgi:hypothetical protein